MHPWMELLAIILKSNAAILLFQTDADSLETQAVQFRYPGMSWEKFETKQALQSSGRICSIPR
jgi:hypothetical protein